jgi:acetyl-CoA acetyltransferase
VKRSEPSVAITGIGTTGFARANTNGLATMCNQALHGALTDAGLSRSAVDGLFVHIGSPRGLDYDVVASLLGLNIRFALQTWAHGRWSATLLMNAAMAVDHGLCDYALCIGCFKNSMFGRHGTLSFPGTEESVREGGGPHAETPHVGMAAPISGAAMALNRYLHRYGVEREKLGAISIAQRKWAQKNPLAVLREPVGWEDYAASRSVVEPLRLLDCSFPIDTATALILTSVDRARELEQTPVVLRGYQGVRAGPSEFVFGAHGLGINQAGPHAEVHDVDESDFYSGMEIDRADVGAFYTYDGFTSQVIYALERFGFAGAGEGVDWVQGGRIEPGGELPTNTSGGHLSEGHSNGWGQTLEIVRQLRGQAGERQVENLQFAQWATTLGDTILYGTDDR